MNEKYLMLSLNDQQTSYVADVLQNKTCKKILAYLTEHDVTATELSNALSLPMNTIHYDLNKLMQAGFIQSKSSFWSVKGKKMPVYALSNKKIIISPRNSSATKSFAVSLFLTGAAAVLIKLFIQPSFSSPVEVERAAFDALSEAGKSAIASAPSSAGELAVGAYSSMAPAIWLWFFLGGVFALMIYLIIRWREF